MSNLRQALEEIAAKWELVGFPSKATELRAQLAAHPNNNVTEWGVSCAVAPTPSLIIIDRNDLPEVRESRHGLDEAGGSKFNARHATPAWWHRRALEDLAIVEFLEARDNATQETKDAEKVAAEKLQERRDALVRELTAEAYGEDTTNGSYENALEAVKVCVNRIIELQDAAK